MKRYLIVFLLIAAIVLGGLGFWKCERSRVKLTLTNEQLEKAAINLSNEEPVDSPPTFNFSRVETLDGKVIADRETKDTSGPIELIESVIRANTSGHIEEIVSFYCSDVRELGKNLVMTQRTPLLPLTLKEGTVDLSLRDGELFFVRAQFAEPNKYKTAFVLKQGEDGWCLIPSMVYDTALRQKFFAVMDFVVPEATKEPVNEEKS